MKAPVASGRTPIPSRMCCPSLAFRLPEKGKASSFQTECTKPARQRGQEPWPACAAGCTPKPIDSLSSAAIRIRKNLGFEVRKAEV